MKRILALMVIAAVCLSLPGIANAGSMQDMYGGMANMADTAKKLAGMSCPDYDKGSIDAINSVRSETWSEPQLKKFLDAVIDKAVKDENPKGLSIVSNGTKGLSPSKTDGVGTMLWMEGYDNSAIYVFAKNAKNNPGRIVTLVNLGVALNDMGYNVEAAIILKYAVAHSQKNPGHALHNLGIVYAELGDMAQARTLLLRATEYFPESMETYLALGRIAQCQGRKDEAKDYLSKAASYGYTPRTQRAQEFNDGSGGGGNGSGGDGPDQGGDGSGDGNDNNSGDNNPSTNANEVPPLPPLPNGRGKKPASPTFQNPDLPELSDPGMKSWSDGMTQMLGKMQKINDEIKRLGEVMEQANSRYARTQGQKESQAAQNTAAGMQGGGSGPTHFPVSDEKYEKGLRQTFEHYDAILEQNRDRSNKHWQEIVESEMPKAVDKAKNWSDIKAARCNDAGEKRSECEDAVDAEMCPPAFSSHKGVYSKFKLVAESRWKFAKSTLNEAADRTGEWVSLIQDKDLRAALDAERKSYLLARYANEYQLAWNDLSGAAGYMPYGGRCEIDASGNVVVRPNANAPDAQKDDCPPSLATTFDLGFMALKLTCEEVEIGGGELVKGKAKWNYKKKEATVFVGGGIDLPGGVGGADAGAYITVSDSTGISDLGLTGSVGGSAAGRSVESQHTFSVFNGYTSDVSTTRMINISSLTGG